MDTCTPSMITAADGPARRHAAGTRAQRTGLPLCSAQHHYWHGPAAGTAMICAASSPGKPLLCRIIGDYECSAAIGQLTAARSTVSVAAPDLAAPRIRQIVHASVPDQDHVRNHSAVGVVRAALATMGWSPSPATAHLTAQGGDRVRGTKISHP